MRKAQRDEWVDEALDAVMSAVAADSWLVGVLVFKGARILGARSSLPARRSFDIDAGLTPQFLETAPSVADQAKRIEVAFHEALTKYFTRLPVVRYAVRSVKVEIKPSVRGHPLGWTGFRVEIGLTDTMRARVNALEALVIDLSHPETLGAASVADLEVEGGGVVHAYTMERIAGEKLRAYLQSLPTYAAKMFRPGDARRTKDVYDLALIERQVPTTNLEFWTRVGEEFRVACEDRLVDCKGLESFREDVVGTKRAYELEIEAPIAIEWNDAWAAIEAIVRGLEARRVVPLHFAVPAGPTVLPEVERRG